MSANSTPLPAISQQIWDMKYRLKGTDGGTVDRTLDDTWSRVAAAVAAAEPKRTRKRWEKAFAEAMADLAFLPAGRILAGAGTGREVTLFNCFVMGRIEDDLGSISRTSAKPRSPCSRAAASGMTSLRSGRRARW
jgi:ribonucleoside-diphosphate reductase alpha chain